jgi:5-methyltetrahydrofolate--homocysteine methyltransferase
VGYAQPLGEKVGLFDLLGAELIGMKLTEHFAMMPAASVSGLYFSHPQSRYFTVGQLEKDQLDDYAKRKGTTRQGVEQWLTSNLSYDPRPAEEAAE